MSWKDRLILLGLSILGAFAFAVLALSRGEPVGAIWILIATLSIYMIGYRYYSYFIAYKAFEINDNNPTPAHKFYNGLDYVPTNKWVLFGHHFASISGAGPLVGPVLAAQMGLAQFKISWCCSFACVRVGRAWVKLRWKSWERWVGL